VARIPAAVVAIALSLAACGGSVGTVSGTVTDPEGRPIQGAVIHTEAIGMQPVTGAGIGTGETGVYTAPLENGLYELTARAEGYGLATKRVYVPSGGDVRIDFVLDRAP
jgi:hypothetical protein